MRLRMCLRSQPDDKQVLSIWREGELLGLVFPTETGIKIVSEYIITNPEESIRIDKRDIPAILINLIPKE